MNLGQDTHIVPVLAPVSTTAAVTTDVVGLKEYEEIEFVVAVGALAVNLTVKLTESTSTTASGTDVAGKYRLSSAVGTDSMGAVTTLASTGVVLTASTDNNKMLLIDVDPATLTDGYPYVFLTLTPASASACLVSAVALLKPRYPKAVQISAVD